VEESLWLRCTIIDGSGGEAKVDFNDCWILRRQTIIPFDLNLLRQF
jgi:hypothetical protein